MTGAFSIKSLKKLFALKLIKKINKLNENALYFKFYSIFLINFNIQNKTLYRD